MKEKECKIFAKIGNVSPNLLLGKAADKKVSNYYTFCLRQLALSAVTLELSY